MQMGMRWASVLVAMLILAAGGLAAGGKQLLFSGGMVHLHSQDDCVSWNLPFFCSDNIPIFFCRYSCHRGQGTLTACKSRLKNLGTALEMYSADHQGRFPAALAKLTPAYLKSIPVCYVCPALQGSDTYSAGYSCATHPDVYTLVCAGWRHRAVNQGANYPQYTSEQGLISQ